MNRYQVTLTVTAENALEIEDFICANSDSSELEVYNIEEIDIESIELVEEEEPSEEPYKMSGEYDA